MSMQAIPLTGLDAQDPLAFLAALGCLAASTERCRRAGLPAPCMRFEFGAVLRPIVIGAFDGSEGLLDSLAADLDVVSGRVGGERDPFLCFSYENEKGEPVYDLKPPPKVFRAQAQAWLADASASERRCLDWAAATLTDVAVDNSGNGKPFALHFTAGQQRFLTVARELLDGGEKGKGKGKVPPVDREDLRNAVFGPWANDRELKVFSWSPTQDRAYALRAVDPADDKKQGTPGADWLALRGLTLMSSAPIGDKIETGGVHGEWKTGSFSYPVWPQSLDADAVRALLRHPAVCEAEQAVGRTAQRTLPRGVEVLSCRISRSDQGGYGAFSRPSRR